MSSPAGVIYTPRKVAGHRANARPRSGAFRRWTLASLTLLTGWWFTAGSAQAVSYPPAIGCAVAGSAPAGATVVQVRGMGFQAGARVWVSVAGRNPARVIADPAGSFEVSWSAGALTAGMTVTAANAGCTTTSLLLIENQQPGPGESSLQPASPGSGSAGGKHLPGGPAPAAGNHPAPGPATSPEPQPPAPQAEPPAAAIPAVPLTGMPPQLFLGLAGAVLLAGAALTGLTGRLGHRSERRSPVTGPVTNSVSATLASEPG